MAGVERAHRRREEGLTRQSQFLSHSPGGVICRCGDGGGSHQHLTDLERLLGIPRGLVIQRAFS